MAPMRPTEELLTNDLSSALFFPVDLLVPIPAIRIGCTQQPRRKPPPRSRAYGPLSSQKLRLSP